MSLVSFVGADFNALIIEGFLSGKCMLFPGSWLCVPVETLSVHRRTLPLTLCSGCLYVFAVGNIVACIKIMTSLYLSEAFQKKGISTLYFGFNPSVDIMYLLIYLRMDQGPQRLCDP